MQATSTSSKKKLSSKPGKKRHHPKSVSAEDLHDSSCNTSDHKSKKKSVAQQSSGASKTGKSKRRRIKHKLDANKQVSQHENQDPDMEISITDQVPDAGMIHSADNAEENLEVTTVQLALAEGRDSAQLQRTSRVEERKREIERKRAEKRELERLKREEEERRAKLQVHLLLHVQLGQDQRSPINSTILTFQLLRSCRANLDGFPHPPSTHRIYCVIVLSVLASLLVIDPNELEFS